MANTWREQRLRILHLEDDPNDAELIRSALEADGLNVDIERVMTADEFVSTLAQDFDLILSDYANQGDGNDTTWGERRRPTPHLEDGPIGAGLIRSAREAGGLNVDSGGVMTADEFVTTLAQDFALILSDYANRKSTRLNSSHRT